MSNVYRNNHGVKFGNKHSFRDYRLYPRSKPVIAPPEPKTNYVNIPGADNALDLTENLTGSVQYESRKATFEYTIIEPRYTWDGILTQLMDGIHGKQMHVILDDAPDGYYSGRLSVSDINFDRKGPAYVTVTALFDAYKYDILESDDEWLWDPFNFEVDAIRVYNELEVNSSTSYTIIGTRMPVVPKFIAHINSGTMTMTYDGETYTLSEGSNTFPELVIGEGEHVFTFTGNGTITIKFRGGHF